MIPMSGLIDLIERETHKDIPPERLKSFRLDCLQYWWLNHELARHHDDLHHISGEMSRAKLMALSDIKGPYYARLLGCLAKEAERHHTARAVCGKQIGKIVETWESFPISLLFEKLRGCSHQWLLIPDPNGEPPREGNDVPPA